jgi:hypothetical protein
MRQSRVTAFVAGAIVALVLGGGSAVAATGGKFILGKSNSAGTTTTLVNKNGTALSLKSKPGTPSLKVSTGTKVPNLNADKLDGWTSDDFALVSGETGSFDAPGELVDLDENGVSDTILAFASCPPGTQMTGGGSWNFTSGYTLVDAPDVDESWLVAVAVEEGVQHNPEDVIASVVCYSPDGAVPGAYRSTGDPLAKASAKTLSRLESSAARR